MGTGIRDKVVILGMGCTRFGERWESGADTILRGAPVLVQVHAHKDERTAPQGCTIATAYLELAATAHGLGACWAGFFNAAALMYPPFAIGTKP